MPVFEITCVDANDGHPYTALVEGLTLSGARLCAVRDGLRIVQRSTRDPDLPPRTASQIVLSDEFVLSRSIKPDVRSAIRAALALSFDEGLTYESLGHAIEKLGIPPEKAFSIACTESARASSIENLESMRASGCRSKQWLVGGSPCVMCQYIAAKVEARGGSIHIDEPFAVAGEIKGVRRDIYYPPAHNKCCCDICGGPSE